jgi:hypothetical protein
VQGNTQLPQHRHPALQKAKEASLSQLLAGAQLLLVLLVGAVLLLLLVEELLLLQQGVGAGRGRRPTLHRQGAAGALRETGRLRGHQ